MKRTEKMKAILGLTLTVFFGMAWGKGIENSSRQKFMGVHGWDFGKDCPGIELVWKTGGVFFRNSPGRDVRIGVGVAIFSPDCKKFWFTTYEEEPTIQVFETRSGRRILSTTGIYPAWSPDSAAIYVSRPEKTLQLWRVSVVNKTKQLVHEVAKYQYCHAPGDGISWHPVTFDSVGNLRWPYRTASEEDKQLLIDAQTHQLLGTETATLYCF